jgi:hypothetical protein
MPVRIGGPRKAASPPPVDNARDVVEPCPLERLHALLNCPRHPAGNGRKASARPVAAAAPDPATENTPGRRRRMGCASQPRENAIPNPACGKPAMTIRHERMLEPGDVEAVIAALTEKAIAGCMVSAKLLLERRPVTSDVITALSMEAVVTAVLQKADAGGKAALRLKAKHLDDRERRR